MKGISSFVSVRLLRIHGRSVDALVPQSGQRYDKESGTPKARTRASGMLLVGGKVGACALWKRSLSDMECLRDCCIACRWELLRTVCCFLITRSCFPTYG